MANRVERPLQVQCAAPSCRRRQNVPIGSLHYVVMPNRSGGTHKDAGWDCRACGHENVTPASHLPKGVLQKLPSRVALMTALAQAAPAGTPTARASVEPVGDQSPVVEPTVATTEAATVQPVRPIPRWIAGPDAWAMLAECAARALDDDDADVVMLAREDGEMEDFGADDEDLAPGALAARIEEIGCETVIIAGGTPDGTRWRLVFLPGPEMASLVSEPA